MSLSYLNNASLGDAHAHLEGYGPADLEAALGKARASGIGTIIANGITLRSSQKSIEIAQKHEGVWATVGIQPWHAERLAGAVSEVEKIAVKDRVAGIGEIGLDFLCFPQTKDLQLQLFDAQLEIARRLDLPVVIHTKHAMNETIAALERNRMKGERCIIHGFTGDLAALEDWVSLGCFLSIGVKIVKKPGEMLEEVIRQVPAGSLLLETDAAARRTLTQGLELATLRTIAEKVAGIRGVTLEELARTTTANLRRAYRIKDDWPAHG